MKDAWHYRGLSKPDITKPESKVEKAVKAA